MAASVELSRVTSAVPEVLQTVAGSCLEDGFVHGLVLLPAQVVQESRLRHSEDPQAAREALTVL